MDCLLADESMVALMLFLGLAGVLIVSSGLFTISIYKLWSLTTVCTYL